MTRSQVEKLHDRVDVLLEERLASRVIQPIIFRGRRILTTADVESVIEEGGRECAARVENEKRELIQS